MNEQQFQQYAERQLNISLTEHELNQFAKYYEELIAWNEKMNLTAITEKQDVYEKHFYDSLSAQLAVSFHDFKTLCDVGAGAGFPSIPLKICFPHLHVTVVDSLNKRITFLKHVIDTLGLSNVQLFHDRAETFGHKKQMRESFDIVTARAVAKLSVLSEYCLPLVKLDGIFLVLKGPKGSEEIYEAKRALATLGGKIIDVVETKLPLEQSERNLLVIKKVKQTPKKYARKPGIPNKEPL